MSFGPPTAVIINDTYPAVAHFEVDAGSFLVVESDATCLIFLDVGVPGPAGAAAGKYTHNQLVASSTWTINHNLGYSPSSVRLLSPGGVEMEGLVLEISNNQLVASLNPPVAGRAIVG